jgi:transglutaminase superfamily protein
MTRESVRLVPTVIEVFGLALWVEVTLRRRPFERILDQVARTAPRSTNPQDLPTPTLERVIRLAYRLLPFEATCLKHSLIFCVVRRRRGLPGELRIGVQKTDGVFAAHAWVEDGHGHILTDPQEGFSPVPLPQAPIPDERASD